MPLFEVKLVYEQQNTYFVEADDEDEALENAEELWVLDEKPHEVNWSDVMTGRCDVRPVQPESSPSQE